MGGKEWRGGVGREEEGTKRELRWEYGTGGDIEFGLVCKILDIELVGCSK